MLQMGREMTAPVTLNRSTAMPAEKRPEDIATAVEMRRGQDLVEHVVTSFGEDFFYAKPAPVTTLQKLRQALSDAAQSTLQNASSVLSSITGKCQLTPMQKVIVAMQKDLTIEPARRSDVVNLTLISTDPEKGMLLLDRFIEFYRQKHLRGYQTPQAREFFELEHDRLGNRLSRAEDQIVQFKAQKQVYSGEEHRHLLLGQQESLQTSADTLRADVTRVTAEIDYLQKSIDGLPPDVAMQAVRQSNPLLDTLREKLTDAGLAGFRRRGLRYVGSDSIKLLHVNRATMGRAASVRQYMAIVGSSPTVLIYPHVWARFVLGLMSRKTIVRLQDWKRSRWHAGHSPVMVIGPTVSR